MGSICPGILKIEDRKLMKITSAAANGLWLFLTEVLLGI